MKVQLADLEKVQQQDGAEPQVRKLERQQMKMDLESEWVMELALEQEQELDLESWKRSWHQKLELEQ